MQFNNVIANVFVAGALLFAIPAHARDNIHIVGSSTVFPFVAATAERFTADGNPAPLTESTGTGGGFKLFCSGIGAGTPDITGASRRIKKSEFELCNQNGVTEISEVMFGVDAVVVSTSRETIEFDLTLDQLYRSVAKYVVIDGALVENPYNKWSDIDSALPDLEILVYGPPPTSGTRDSFVELALDVGCRNAMESAGLEYSKDTCHQIREDQRFVEAGENDNLIVQKLQGNPGSLGIFGFSFLDQSSDIVRGVVIDGVMPDYDTISTNEYVMSRPLYIYVKNQHKQYFAGIDQFVHLLVSGAGEDGFLSDKGLVPLSDESLSDPVIVTKEGLH